MDRDHGAAAARLLIAIFPYQRNFLVEKLTELQRSLRLLLEALPKSTIWRAGLMREFPQLQLGWNLPLRSVWRIALRLFGQKGNVRCAHSNSLRSLLEALPKSTIWRAGLMREFPSFSWQGAYRSVFPCESPCGGICRNGMNTVAVCRDL